MARSEATLLGCITITGSGMTVSPSLTHLDEYPGTLIVYCGRSLARSADRLAHLSQAAIQRPFSHGGRIISHRIDAADGMTEPMMSFDVYHASTTPYVPCECV